MRIHTIRNTIIAVAVCYSALFFMAFFFFSTELTPSNSTPEACPNPKSNPATVTTTVESTIGTCDAVLMRQFNNQQDLKILKQGKRTATMSSQRPPWNGGGEFIIPIAIYVHNRPVYFKQVVEAFRQVTDISETILIISHDGSFQEMFDIVNSIDFCTVIELVHPGYNQSSPLHPKQKLKRHWWWFMEMLYSGLESLKPYDFIVVIEEDHKVTPDFYLTAKATLNTFYSQLVDDLFGPFCFNLYTHYYDKATEDAHRTFVINLFDNTGYGISRHMWRRIKEAESIFWGCDCGWDHCIAVMQHLGIIPHLCVATLVPRIRNIGSVGVHVTSGSYKALRLGEVKTSQWTSPDFRSPILDFKVIPRNYSRPCFIKMRKNAEELQNELAQLISQYLSSWPDVQNQDRNTAEDWNRLKDAFANL